MPKLEMSVYDGGVSFSSPEDRSWLPTEAYRAALAVFIRVCVDVVIYSQERREIYLAKRVIPIQGWHCFGGTVLPGEDFPSAAKRHVATDVSLNINPEELDFFRLARYKYHGPEGGPVDSIAVQFSLPIESSSRVLEQSVNPDEYDASLGVRGFNRERLEEEEEDLHPGVMDIYRTLFGGCFAGSA